MMATRARRTPSPSATTATSPGPMALRHRDTLFILLAAAVPWEIERLLRESGFTVLSATETTATRHTRAEPELFGLAKRAAMPAWSDLRWASSQRCRR